MKLNKKKLGFTLVELLVVIAILAILATVSIIGYKSFIDKANDSNDESVVTELNNYLKAANPLDDKVPTATDAYDLLKGTGLHIDELQPFNKDNKYGYNYEAKEFVVIRADWANPIANSDNYKTFVFVKDQTQMNKAFTNNYSVYLQTGFDASSINATYGVDVGSNTNIQSINYTSTSDRTVVIRTNGGSLTVNAENGKVQHYGESNIVNLTAVDTQSYYENGTVNQINIKKGRLVITNNEEASVNTIFIQATNDSYDDIILATQAGAELPELIARDNVSEPEGNKTKKVVTIQTNVNEQGQQPQKTETINLYATAQGTSGNDVYEATNGYNVSQLALLVVEASSTDAQERAAEQITDQTVLNKVTEEKAAVEVANRTELETAVNAEAKYIKIVKDFTADAYINIKKSAIIDGDGHTITSTATRGLRVTESNVDLTLKNVKVIGSANTERAIQVDSNKANVKLNLLNVEASSTYYAVNVCSYSDVELYMESCKITGWAAINLWGENYNVTVKNSELIGINDKGYNAEGWNDFGTICLEGDTTGETDLHSAAINVKIINTKITAKQTNGNTQFLVLFNPSVANIVSLEGCTLDSYTTDQTKYYGEFGINNRLFVDGVEYTK